MEVYFEVRFLGIEDGVGLGLTWMVESRSEVFHFALFDYLFRVQLNLLLNEATGVGDR